MTYGMFTPYAGAGSFGHSGAGGSNAFAQPERDLAVGYVMNKMAANLAADGRAQRITIAAAGVVDSL
jgi:CubicO group peptidase (beta-lactamase class C family)